MPVLRYAYVLALAVWLGGMIVLGAVVAPATFQVLPAIEPDSGRALAGAVFGGALARFHYLAYAAGGLLVATLALMAVLGPRPRHFALRTAIASAMLGVALYSGIVVLGEIDGLQRELATLSSASTLLPSQLPPDDPRRMRFDHLHQLSTRLMLANIAGALVLLLWEAREPGR